MIDRIPDSNHLAVTFALGGIVVIREDDIRAKIIAGDECKNLCERLGIVRHLQFPAVGEIRDNEFSHEGLEPELLVLLLAQLDPEFQQADDLREMGLVGLLAPPNEVQVHGNAREQLLARVRGHEVSLPVQSGSSA